ncbi:ABC transporter substrate-binding protein [Pseudofrankia sp. BMG5.37]|uniref:ABC transporter substrate-binding protein n=1 Tax=Pseudofrankia sp. BMG5.37 TaxID=3050035 RepID=UPI0028950CC4|nr:ABC transporter substrate-binding protein [Pseudofrankia sp. BMG5.37]MDT3441516.1 ABC transporter substrate-binding protein [Pseudofrankia sp. BMG5.37]
MKGQHLRGRTVAAAAATLLGLSAAAGCASASSSPGSTDAADSSCPSPGVTSKTIKLGLIYPDTGGVVSAAFHSARSAIEARVDLQNAKGGVHGRQVVLEWRDDESTPEAFSRAAHDLLDNEHVFGLIAQSIVIGPSAEWMDKAGVPVVGVAADKSWTEGHDNMFNFGSLFNEGKPVSTFGEYVKKQGGTKAYLVVDQSSPASHSLAVQFAPSLTSQGVSVVGTSDYSESVSSPAKVVDGLRRTGADALIGTMQPEPYIDILAAAKAAGIRLKVALVSAGYGTQLLSTRGRDMAGMSVITGYQSFQQNSPTMRAYHDAMAAYAPELPDPDEEVALASYVTADEMLLGLDRAGQCPTREAFIQNLRQVHDYSAGGLIAPVDLNEPEAPAKCFNFLRVNAAGDAFEVVPGGNGPAGFWCGTALGSGGARK